MMRVEKNTVTAEPSDWSKNRKTRAQRLTMHQLRDASASLIKAGLAANWFCVAVAAGKEFQIEQKFLSAGVEVFVAKEPWSIVKKGRKYHGERPLISGYMLVHLVPSDAAFQGVLQQKDVFGFVGIAGRYHVMKDSEVAAFIHLSEKHDISRMAVDRSIAQGDLVEIIAGPFAGFICAVTRVMSGRNPKASVIVSAGNSKLEIASMPIAFLKKS